MGNIVNIVSGNRAKDTFYPTPEDVAEKLLSGIDFNLVSTVLEPSAGKGDLALVIAKKIFYNRQRYPVHDEHTLRQAIAASGIDCIEIDPMLRNTLEGAGWRVVHDDFLTYETHKHYSLIAMNPPFDEGAKHLLKALELAEAHGGMVRCILNADTIRNPYTNERVRLMNELNRYGATIRYVQNAFSNAERQTDVEIALVSVDIEAPQLESTIMEDMRKAPTYKTQEIPNEYSDIVKYNKIDEWVNRYNFEVACGIRLIEEYSVMAQCMLNTPDDKYANPILTLKVSAMGEYSELDINDYVRETRGKYWRMIFQQPMITERLTENLQRELHSNVEALKDYEFSAFNILTLVIKMNGKVLTGIEDTIVNLFDDWTRRDWHGNSPNIHYYNGWKTNSAFRVGKKVIIPFYDAFDTWDRRFKSWYVIGKFTDIEKVFSFLDNGRTNWEGSLESSLKMAEATQNTRNIDTKYFSVSLYKKGTAHFVFKDEDLLEKFNLFASRKKGWLPPDYGKKRYSDMSAEEQDVVDSFQGKEKYEEVMLRADYYLDAGQSQQFMLGAGVGA